MLKVYESFDEIDRDLKILKLQQKIDEEEVKFSLNQVKEAISPVGVAANLVGAIAQKAVVLNVINKLFGFKRVKKVEKSDE